MFIECHDAERTDHMVWVRTAEVKAVHLRQPPGGETWQVYVEAAVGTFRFGKLEANREDAERAVRTLAANLAQ